MLTWRSIPLWGRGSWKLVNQKSGSELCKFPNHCWEWWYAETLLPIVLNSFSLRTSHGIETSKLWLMTHSGKHDFITEKHHFWIWALLVTSQDYCTSHKGHSWWMVQNCLLPISTSLCGILWRREKFLHGDADWDTVGQKVKSTPKSIAVGINYMPSCVTLATSPIAAVKHQKDETEGRKGLWQLRFWEDMDYLHREGLMGSWWMVALEASAWSYLLSCWWIKKQRDWGQRGWVITSMWPTSFS